MIPRTKRFTLGFALTLLAGLALTAMTGCSPAFGGQVSVLEQAQSPTYQVQTVQDPDQVHVQTRTRQVMQEQTITEQVPVEHTVMVPTKVTSLETRTRTVCVPKLLQEQVTVRVQSPPRQVVVAVQPPPVQTVAVGLHARSNPLRSLLGSLRRN